MKRQGYAGAMTDCDLLITGARLATMRPGTDAYGEVDDGWVAIRDSRIAAVGGAGDQPPLRSDRTVELDGRWLTPGLIDCHTHLVFAGHRADEFERRLEGESYESVAAAGGGIMSTVRATRDASDADLSKASAARLALLAAEGVTTVEVKSGYGLNIDTERKMLRVARTLGEQTSLSISTSFLGAHTVPADWNGSRASYVDHLINDMLPAVAEVGLADAVDAYCESIAFSADEIDRLFTHAASLSLPVRLHADQLSNGGGAELAAKHEALSADHLEYASDDGINAMAAAGTVAVMLPGAYLNLRESQRPPIDAMRACGVPIAIASDCNPGTSPVCSLLASLHLATALFRLTPAECLAGVTIHAARALGLQDDRGSIEPGKRADLIAWDFDHPAELSYWLGRHRPSLRVVGGQVTDAKGSLPRD